MSGMVILVSVAVWALHH